MLERFFPEGRIASVYEAEYGQLYQEGVRALLYDIDNTLVLHDEPATEEAVELFGRLHALGFRVGLLSNNHEPRVRSFAEKVQADIWICRAHKPSASGYLRAAEELGLSREQLFFFGDQLFTDILGAKNAGIRHALVKPIGKEKLLRIRLKRLLEYPVLLAYERRKAEGKRE